METSPLVEESQAIPAAPPTEPRSGYDFEMVPVTRVVESPKNNRKRFDEKKMLELADSMRTSGVISPLVGRPIDGGLIELAAGHRRRRAALMIGLEQLPVMIRPMSDREFVEALNVENLQRVDVHALEEAAGYADLRADAGYTVEEIAARVGKSESYIYGRLKLIDLIPALQDDYYADRIPTAHALELARLLPEDQEALRKDGLYTYQWGLSKGTAPAVPLNALRQRIESSILLDLAKAPFSIKDPELVPSAGACPACPRRTGAAPALWPEIKKGDRCLDRECFRLKSETHRRNVVNRWVEKAGVDGPVVKVSQEYGTPAEDDVLPESAWVLAEEDCGSRRAAVVVGITTHAPIKLKLGQAVDVCLNKRCPAHWTKSSGGGKVAPADVKKELARQQSEETDREILAALTGGVVDITVWPLDELTLKLVVIAWWESIWGDVQRRIIARREIKKTGKSMREHIDAMTADQLAGLLLEMAIGRWPHDGPPLRETLEALLEEDAKPLIAEARKAVSAKFAKKRKALEGPKKKAEEKAPEGVEKPKRRGRPPKRQESEESPVAESQAAPEVELWQEEEPEVAEEEQG